MCRNKIWHIHLRMLKSFESNLFDTHVSTKNENQRHRNEKSFTSDAHVVENLNPSILLIYDDLRLNKEEWKLDFTKPLRNRPNLFSCSLVFLQKSIFPSIFMRRTVYHRHKVRFQNERCNLSTMKYLRLMYVSANTS